MDWREPSRVFVGLALGLLMVTVFVIPRLPVAAETVFPLYTPTPVAATPTPTGPPGAAAIRAYASSFSPPLAICAVTAYVSAHQHLPSGYADLIEWSSAAGLYDGGKATFTCAD
ncbi:MAG: hypothetical protein JOZ39_12235 [Chloroflexi bacterium]|nr:hypothetical protein [Chloroflexota bacterium]